MKLHKLLVATSLACALSPAMADAPQHVAIPADVNDVKQILRAYGYDKLAVLEAHRAFVEGSRAHPDAGIDPDVFLTFFTADAVDEHLAPIFATYLTPDDSHKLLAALESPGAAIMLRINMIEAESGAAAAKAETAKLSAAELRLMNEFKDSEPERIMGEAVQNSATEARKAIADWTKEASQERMMLAKKQIMDLYLEELQAKNNSDNGAVVAVPATQISRIGIRSLDEVMRVTAELMHEIAQLHRCVVRENSALHLASVLAAENLVTQEGIEAGHLTVLTAENTFDEHMKAAQALAAGYERNINNIAMSPQSRKQILDEYSQSMARSFDLQVRESERLQNILELQKQILTLCESNLGKTKLEHEKLIFPADGSAQTYNTLVAKIRAEDVEIAKIEDEHDDRMKNTFGNMQKQ